MLAKRMTFGEKVFRLRRKFEKKPMAEAEKNRLSASNLVRIVKGTNASGKIRYGLYARPK